MTKDDFPEPLVPLTIHENGCLNFRSSLIDGRAVKTLLRPSLVLFIPERDRRIVRYASAFEERDSVHFMLGFGYYRNYTPSRLTLTFGFLLCV